MALSILRGMVVWPQQSVTLTATKKHEFDMDFGVVPWLSLASGGACERTCGLGWYRPPV